MLSNEKLRELEEYSNAYRWHVWGIFEQLMLAFV